MGVHPGIKNDVLPVDVIPERGRQSGPVEEFDQEREVAFAERFFQIPAVY